MLVQKALRKWHIICDDGALHRLVRCMGTAGDAPKPVREPAWKPYMELARMDKPIGSMLLFWPCCWGVALATPATLLPDIALLA
jgi:hypothetical protein